MRTNQTLGLALALTIAGTAAAQNTLRLTAVIRDFRQDHPDMEFDLFTEVIPNLQVVQEDAVLSTLGSDGDPVFNGAGKTFFSTAENFDQWYDTVPGVNIEIRKTLTFTETFAGSGIYAFSDNFPAVPGTTFPPASGNFFPINNEGFGNEGNANNQHFTMELRTEFTYQGGEFFNYTGDDDLWVFINGQRVIDLGGVHQALDASVNLDDVATELGLEIGETYSFDLFYAERNTVASNFNAETSIVLIPSPGGLGVLGGLALLTGVRRRR